MSGMITLIVDWVDRIFTWPVLLCRLWKYKYTFRKIYLGEGKWTKVSPRDYYWLKKFKWILYGTGCNFYVIRHKIIGPNKTATVYMHREIMNAPKGRLVDHRNDESLDNRRDNLRFATPSQNMLNRKKKSNSSSNYRGVWLLPNGKYESQITNNGKKVHLGWFTSEIDAAKAFDEAAQKYHGEFAKLNFPESADCVQRSADSNKKEGLAGRRRFSIIRFLLSVLGFY